MNPHEFIIYLTNATILFYFVDLLEESQFKHRTTKIFQLISSLVIRKCPTYKLKTQNQIINAGRDEW